VVKIKKILLILFIFSVLAIAVNAGCPTTGEFQTDNPSECTNANCKTKVCTDNGCSVTTSSYNQETFMCVCLCKKEDCWGKNPGDVCDDDGNDCTYHECDANYNCVKHNQPENTPCDSDDDPCLFAQCDANGNCYITNTKKPNVECAKDSDCVDPKKPPCNPETCECKKPGVDANDGRVWNPYNQENPTDYDPYRLDYFDDYEELIIEIPANEDTDGARSGCYKPGIELAWGADVQWGVGASDLDYAQILDLTWNNPIYTDTVGDVNGFGIEIETSLTTILDGESLYIKADATSPGGDFATIIDVGGPYGAYGGITYEGAQFEGNPSGGTGIPEFSNYMIGIIPLIMGIAILFFLKKK
jgi:hypothetical protein